MTRPVFELAERYMDQRLALDPYGATFLGAPGYDHLCTDLSPAGAEERAAVDRELLVELAGLPEHVDDVERIAAAVIKERIESRLISFETGEHLRDIGVLWSSAHLPRMVFDLMPRETEEHWANIASRLDGVAAALAGERESLESGVAQGLFAARRQALGVARTFRVWSGLEAEGDSIGSWFSGLVSGYPGGELAETLEAAATRATNAYAEFAAYLEHDYAPIAPERDGVGEQRYATLARYWTGADLDLRETYAWGWAEAQRIASEIREVCARILPGATVGEVVEALDSDDAYRIDGPENLIAHLQTLTDDTIAEFAGTYFDIPDVMRKCEARIAPPGGAAAPYYNGPSEDFSRPGTTWYPTLGETSFSTWRLPTMWFHEAVPGHHLQVAYAVYRADRLSRIQRTEFVSGHGEGWALYAERLMAELGHYSDPAHLLGHLAAQQWRAVRVVLDIGLHLDLPVPQGPRLDGAPEPGSAWTRDDAVTFLRTQALLADAMAASEVDRYLGLPGQAISYKVGERVWLECREAARQRHGDAFDLKAWHKYALELGSMGLDPMRVELAGF